MRDDIGIGVEPQIGNLVHTEEVAPIGCVAVPQMANLSWDATQAAIDESMEPVSPRLEMFDLGGVVF